jgi:hypothetical protein
MYDPGSVITPATHSSERRAFQPLDNAGSQGYMYWWSQNDLSLIFHIFFEFRLANKQDIIGAMDEEEIYQCLDLGSIAARNKCPCQVVSKSLII